jgi:hypothetical protein
MIGGWTRFSPLITAMLASPKECPPCPWIGSSTDAFGHSLRRFPGCVRYCKVSEAFTEFAKTAWSCESACYMRIFRKSRNCVGSPYSFQKKTSNGNGKVRRNQHRKQRNYNGLGVSVSLAGCCSRRWHAGCVVVYNVKPRCSAVRITKNKKTYEKKNSINNVGGRSCRLRNGGKRHPTKRIGAK